MSPAYCVTNRPEEAEPLYRRALAIDEASLGPDHYEVATDLNNLALALKDTNHLREAEPYFRRAWHIYEASLGPKHPLVAGVLYNLATLQRLTGAPKEALQMLVRSASIYLAQMSELGCEHPNLGLVLNTYADVLRLDFGLGPAKGDAAVSKLVAGYDFLVHKIDGGHGDVA